MYTQRQVCTHGDSLLSRSRVRRERALARGDHRPASLGPPSIQCTINAREIKGIFAVYTCNQGVAHTHSTPVLMITIEKCPDKL